MKRGLAVACTPDGIRAELTRGTSAAYLEHSIHEEARGASTQELGAPSRWRLRNKHADTPGAHRLRIHGYMTELLTARGIVCIETNSTDIPIMAFQSKRDIKTYSGRSFCAYRLGSLSTPSGGQDSQAPHVLRSLYIPGSRWRWMANA